MVTMGENDIKSTKVIYEALSFFFPGLSPALFM